MNDRFFSLQLFARVARTGSFSVAAREFAISQPSASRTVAALEKKIGVALLTRSTRALTLTEAGTDYLIGWSPYWPRSTKRTTRRAARANCAVCSVSPRRRRCDANAVSDPQPVFRRSPTAQDRVHPSIDEMKMSIIP
jgi:hypothetical protein